MFVKPFRYERAASVEEACALLQRYEGGAKLLAGGQSLLPMLNLGVVDVDALIDVGRIAGLAGVAEENGSLLIGALTTERTLERDPAIGRRQPLLSAAAGRVGNPRVRNRGTVGGSLVHNDPAAELPLVMAVAGADHTVSDGRSERVVAAHDFTTGYFSTDLAENEMLISVGVRALRPGEGWAFHEVSRRPGDFAIVAAAAVARCSDGLIAELRIGITGVGDGPLRWTALEEAARGRAPDEIPGAVADLSLEIDPPSDTNATGEYRRHVARVLTARAVADACHRSEAA